MIACRSLILFITLCLVLSGCDGTADLDSENNNEEDADSLILTDQEEQKADTKVFYHENGNLQSFEYNPEQIFACPKQRIDFYENGSIKSIVLNQSCSENMDSSTMDLGNTVYQYDVIEVDENGEWELTRYRKDEE